MAYFITENVKKNAALTMIKSSRKHVGGKERIQEYLDTYCKSDRNEEKIEFLYSLMKHDKSFYSDFPEEFKDEAKLFKTASLFDKCLRILSKMFQALARFISNFTVANKQSHMVDDFIRDAKQLSSKEKNQQDNITQTHHMKTSISEIKSNDTSIQKDTPSNSKYGANF
tara:strand:- start:1594 stop:2100 length:507 start_codon:yes stop_codon:yes gene_type:complete